jgi:hypothetical protein
MKYRHATCDRHRRDVEPCQSFSHVRVARDRWKNRSHVRPRQLTRLGLRSERRRGRRPLPFRLPQYLLRRWLGLRQPKQHLRRSYSRGGSPIPVREAPQRRRLCGGTAGDLPRQRRRPRSRVEWAMYCDESRSKREHALLLRPVEGHVSENVDMSISIRGIRLQRRPIDAPERGAIVRLHRLRDGRREPSASMLHRRGQLLRVSRGRQSPRLRPRHTRARLQRLGDARSKVRPLPSHRDTTDDHVARLLLRRHHGRRGERRLVPRFH